jgi:hypothetical protein
MCFIPCQFALITEVLELLFTVMSYKCSVPFQFEDKFYYLYKFEQSNFISLSEIQKNCFTITQF